MSESRDALLELLLQGPSSFAACHGYLVRQVAARPRVEVTWETVSQLEREGLVDLFLTSAPEAPLQSSDPIREQLLAQYRAWLDVLDNVDLTTDRLSVDEVGLWLQLSKSGQELVGAQGDDDDNEEEEEEEEEWMLDVDEEKGSVTVYGGTEEAVRDALEAWLARRGLRATNVEMQDISSFVLRTGKRVAPGVRLRAALRDRG